MRVPGALIVLFALAAAPSPEPVPSSAPLPEIGRTRATSASCAAMRDIVVPAFAAARRADARFEDVRKRLVRYATFASTNGTHIGAMEVDDGAVFREAELSKLDTDAARLLQETQVMRKLIDDPRLAADVKDVSVQEERAQLIHVYEQQQTRAALLQEFVQRESVGAAKRLVGMGNDRGIAPKAGKFEKEVDPPPQAAPPPPPTAAPGMPRLTGSDIADRGNLAAWGDRAAYVVRATENEASKTFLPLAQNCRFH